MMMKTMMLLHRLIMDSAVPATGTEYGLNEGSHCMRCHYKIAQKAAPATGHTDRPKAYIDLTLNGFAATDYAMTDRTKDICSD